MIEIIKTFLKKLSVKSFGKKYANNVKCYLYLEGKLDIFKKS
jgi:hypothetical protein